MNASIHKLTAGSGYDYLTRQVAVQDSTEKGHASLASYYSEKGETPGTWHGSGLDGLQDLQVGDLVTADQMRALFGSGQHPNMAARLAALPDGATAEQVTDAARLGTPFRVLPDVTEFQRAVASGCSKWQVAHPGLAEVPLDVRAEVRNGLATEQFFTRFGRNPTELELSSEVSRLSRTASTACAGYDLTFTPVKSVSALWAVAPVDLAAAIERAHRAAVTDALGFLERYALFTRAGAGGVRQLDVRGLVAATFVHRDSRSGDPNLHTHVAIANKVQTLDGRWLAIDGRLIFKAMVAVSETYNTQLEAHLASLGIRFRERPGDDPSKRPVREVIGVPVELTQRWSTRRAVIVARQERLAAKFQHDHGRPPTPTEAIKLAQQATLETRDAKHEPRSVAQQRRTWRTEAELVIGTRGIDAMMASTTSSPAHTRPITAGWVQQTGAEIITAMEHSRATWQVWHLRAEASRRARVHAIDPATAERLTQSLLQQAIALSLPLGPAGHDGLSEPALLRRLDGTSTYTVSGSQLFTSRAILLAEEEILGWAGRDDGRRIDERFVSLALLESTANGVTLNPGQTRMVRQMATSGARLQLALAAAGSGKTTALSVLAAAWRDSGGEVLGLAPSAVAASALRDQVGHASTLAKLVWDLDHHQHGEPTDPIGPDTLVIIDEAGMADTNALAKVVGHVTRSGGSLRLIGDDQQLAAISAGGVLRDIADTHGAVELTELVRFRDPAEAAASLALRDGSIEALGFYLDTNRIHAGTKETSLEAAFRSWIDDVDQGMDSIMLAGTRDQVADLNRRARAHRISTPRAAAPGATVLLADGNHGSVGDIIITRLNSRRLRVSPTDWVKNGDRWTIQQINHDGDLRVRHRDSGLSVTLPVGYCTDHVQLGYAATVHSAQGLTVDTTHGVLTGVESRQQLYVMTTRGRAANHIYVPVVGDGDEHSTLQPTTLRPPSATQVLEGIIGRDGSARSATTEARTATDPRTQLGNAAARYQDAIQVAAEKCLPAPTVWALDNQANQVVPGITDATSWPALRSALLLNAVSGHNPVQALRSAATGRELHTAHDPAAVLTWRIRTATEPGPLPWLPPIPDALAANATWGHYLNQRAELVRHCTQQLRDDILPGRSPSWALPSQQPTAPLIADVETWRAATGVDPGDRRPTGEIQLGAQARSWQRHLEQQLQTPTTSSWTDVLTTIHPQIQSDPFSPVLTQRLVALEGTGVQVGELVTRAAAEGPLPVDQPAAALWWRLSRHLTASDAAQAGITGRGQNQSPARIDPPSTRADSSQLSARQKDGRSRRAAHHRPPGLGR